MHNYPPGYYDPYKNEPKLKPLDPSRYTYECKLCGEISKTDTVSDLCERCYELNPEELDQDM